MNTKSKKTVSTQKVRPDICSQFLFSIVDKNGVVDVNVNSLIIDIKITKNKIKLNFYVDGKDMVRQFLRTNRFLSINILSDSGDTVLTEHYFYSIDTMFIKKFSLYLNDKDDPKLLEGKAILKLA